jgi:hypothetical protein
LIAVGSFAKFNQKDCVVNFNFCHFVFVIWDAVSLIVIEIFF